MPSEKIVIARNTSILMITEIITRILGALLTILIARKLGAEKLGLLSFAISFTELFGFIIRFGFKNLISRDIAKYHDKSGVYLGGILLIEVFFSMLILFVITGIMSVMKYNLEKKNIILLATFILIFSSIIDFFHAFFRAYQKAVYEALIKIFLNVFVSLTGILIIWMGFGLKAMMDVRLIVYILSFILGYFLLTRNFTKPVFNKDPKFLFQLTKMAFPFASLGIIISLNTQMSTILISIMKGDTVTGWFSAALRICGVLTFLPLAFVGSVLPAMSKYYHLNNRTLLCLSYERTLKYLFIIIIPIAVGFTVLGGPIIHFVYGDRFESSVILLKILGWMLVFSFLNHSSMIAFSAIDKERTFVNFQAIGTIANLILGIVFIHFFNAKGLCFSNLFSQGIIFCLSSYELSKLFHEINLYRLFIKPLIAAFLMGIFIFFFFQVNLIFLIVCSSILYALFLLALKTFNVNEISTVKKMLINQ